jgi:hypothetical protein
MATAAKAETAPASIVLAPSVVRATGSVRVAGTDSSVLTLHDTI